MAAAGENIEIVFRYLMLYYSSPDGLRVLIPHKGHRTILRDTATDTRIHLNEAFVRVEIDGQPAPASHSTIVPNGRLVSMEQAMKVASAAPAATFLSMKPVEPTLNALVHLSGGTLTAYPMEAFPELADTPARIEFGPANQLDSLITDTTVFQAPLPAGRKCELVIVSPRRTMRLDISGGARFEVRNEDEKTGPALDRLKHASTEFLEILRLFNYTVKMECDYVACLCAYCGQ